MCVYVGICKDNLWRNFRFTTKLRGRYRDFPYILCPYTCIAFPITNIIQQQNGTFVCKDEPTLPHHNHSKSTVQLKIHTWCCTLCVFGQMYNDKYSSLQDPLCSAYSSLPTLTSGNPWTFYCLHTSTFSIKSYNWNYTVYIFSDCFLSLGRKCTEVSSVSFHGFVTHFFIALNNIQLPGCTIVCSFTY